jgi:hypothetical protein
MGSTFHGALTEAWVWMASCNNKALRAWNKDGVMRHRAPLGPEFGGHLVLEAPVGPKFGWGPVPGKARWAPEFGWVRVREGSIGHEENRSNCGQCD